MAEEPWLLEFRVAYLRMQGHLREQWRNFMETIFQSTEANFKRTPETSSPVFTGIFDLH